MGQGCNSGCSSTYFGSLTPDKRIEYTGVSIPSLGICTHDLLSEVDAVILQKILDFSTGIGISIANLDLTGCACFTASIGCCGACTDLNCILQAYADCLCSMYTDLQVVKTKIAEMYDGPYVVDCLTANSSGAITTASKLPAIVQELITEFCDLYGQVQIIQAFIDNFTTTINTTIGNFLLSAISSCQGNTSVIKSGTGATASIAFKGFVPVGGIIPYGGPTAGLFNSVGLGLANTTMCGWALCNGLNGTVNMIGQYPLGSLNMGGTPPTNTVGEINLPLLATVGVASVTLTAAEIPSVAITGSLTDPGHNHAINLDRTGLSTAGGGATQGIAIIDNANLCTIGGGIPNTPTSGFGGASPTMAIVTSKTGISLAGAATAGGGGSHNNIPPSTILYYIQRIS